MSRPIVKIVELDETEIERAMNDEEFAQWELDVEADRKRVAKLEAEAQAKQALLDRLGITEDEAKLLLG